MPAVNQLILAMLKPLNAYEKGQGKRPMPTVLRLVQRGALIAVPVITVACSELLSLEPEPSSEFCAVASGIAAANPTASPGAPPEIQERIVLMDGVLARLAQSAPTELTPYVDLQRAIHSDKTEILEDHDYDVTAAKQDPRWGKLQQRVESPELADEQDAVHAYCDFS